MNFDEMREGLNNQRRENSENTAQQQPVQPQQPTQQQAAQSIRQQYDDFIVQLNELIANKDKDLLYIPNACELIKKGTEILQNESINYDEMDYLLDRLNKLLSSISDNIDKEFEKELIEGLNKIKKNMFLMISNVADLLLAGKMPDDFASVDYMKFKDKYQKLKNKYGVDINASIQVEIEKKIAKLDSIFVQQQSNQQQPTQQQSAQPERQPIEVMYSQLRELSNDRKKLDEALKDIPSFYYFLLKIIDSVQRTPNLSNKDTKEIIQSVNGFVGIISSKITEDEFKKISSKMNSVKKRLFINVLDRANLLLQRQTGPTFDEYTTIKGEYEQLKNEYEFDPYDSIHNEISTKLEEIEKKVKEQQNENSARPPQPQQPVQPQQGEQSDDRTQELINQIQQMQQQMQQMQQNNLYLQQILSMMYQEKARQAEEEREAKEQARRQTEEETRRKFEEETRRQAEEQERRNSEERARLEKEENARMSKLKNSIEQNRNDFQKKLESLKKDKNMSIPNLINNVIIETINWYIADYDSEIYRILENIEIEKLGTENRGFFNTKFGSGMKDTFYYDFKYGSEIKKLAELSRKKERTIEISNDLSKIRLSLEAKKLKNALLKKPDNEKLREEFVNELTLVVSKYLDPNILQKIKGFITIKKYSREKREDYLAKLRAKKTNIIGLTSSEILDIDFDYSKSK